MKFLFILQVQHTTSAACNQEATTIYSTHASQLHNIQSRQWAHAKQTQLHGPMTVYTIHPTSVWKLQSCLNLASLLVNKSFWNFAQSTAVRLPCSVQNFRWIGWLTDINALELRLSCTNHWYGRARFWFYGLCTLLWPLWVTDGVQSLWH